MAKAATKAKAVTKPRAKKAAAPVKILAYKAFDQSLACRGFQYEVGKTYEHSGRVAMCDSGFHSCVEPLDVLNYYDITSSRFATVKAGGKIERRDDGDSKICSASISIVAELKLSDFIGAAIKATFAACKASKVEGAVTSGHSAKNASSGHYATNASSGHSATNATTGEHAVIAAAGRNSQAKGAKGVWISQAEYNRDGHCIGFATGQAGYGDVPADTWLIAKGGKLVPA